MPADEIVLETERLKLVPWRADQVDDLVRLHGDPRVARYLSADGHPWTRAQCVQRLAVWLDNFAACRMGKLRAIRKSDDVMVGRAGFGLHPPTGVPEIGFALYPQYHGHGYAREAAAGLRDWIFAATGHDHFIGLADARNEPSLKVLRAIGMAETHCETFEGRAAQFFVLRRP